ncbi:MAG: multidrug efflux SMR transporter [Pseudomonadota bacterium]
MAYVYLAIAIVSEVIGTLALKASNGFANLQYSALAFVGYAIAFYFLTQVMRTVPVGVTYAIWSGAGVALVAILGLVLFGQKLDAAALLGIGLIVAGVLVLNLFSNSIPN